MYKAHYGLSYPVPPNTVKVVGNGNRAQQLLKTPTLPNAIFVLFEQPAVSLSRYKCFY